MLQRLDERDARTAQGDGPLLAPAERRWLETVTRLQAQIQVRPRLATNLVDVIMQGPNPRAVVEQVNMLAEIYIQESLEAKLAESRKAIAWLPARIHCLAAKDRPGGVDPGNIQIRQGLPPHWGPRVTAGHCRTTARAPQCDLRGNQYRSPAGSKPKLPNSKSSQTSGLSRIFQVPDMEENLRTLKGRYLEAQLEYASLAQNFGPKHPRLIQVKANLDERARAIGAEIRNMISQRQQDYNTLLAKENMLAKELASQKAEVFGFSDDVRQYQTLRRDLDIDQNLHLAVSKRHAEAALSEALTTNNIRLVERAMGSIPVSEAMKMMALNLMLGLTLGVGLTLITEYLDKRFKSADEAEQSVRSALSRNYSPLPEKPAPQKAYHPAGLRL